MDKKQQLLQTALKLFVENGFHGTATSKIALDSGVATGTLFNYFKTKEELILGLYDVIIKELDDFILDSIGYQSISKETFESVFKAAVAWRLANTEKYRYLLQFKFSPFYKIRFSVSNLEVNPIHRLIQNGIDVVVLKSLPVALVYSLFSAQVNGLCEYFIVNKFDTNHRDLVTQETFDLLWKMIKE